jgi:prevent-host-death family protein
LRIPAGPRNCRFANGRNYPGLVELKTITYTEARDRFADVLNTVEATRDVILITRRGHANVALIAEEELSGLQEPQPYALSCE